MYSAIQKSKEAGWSVWLAMNADPPASKVDSFCYRKPLQRRKKEKYQTGDEHVVKGVD